MNKFMRIVVILVVLVVIVVVAGSQTAWAGKLAAPAVGVSNAAADVTGSFSTVRPGGCDDGVSITRTVKSVCGVATIVSTSGQTIGKAFLGNRPHGFKNKKITVYLKTAGIAKLCFGARRGGVIYFYNKSLKAWKPVATTVTNGVACALISNSGDYVLGK